MDEVDAGDFPYVCSPCLGSKHATIVRDSRGSECRMCHKPFVSYDWPHKNGRRKSTVICKDCAMKNSACQSCIKDIRYGVDLPLRDATLRILKDEGGATEEQTDEIFKLVAQRFSMPVDKTKVETESLVNKVSNLMREFPVPSAEQPAAGSALCVYGIEQDLNLDELRSFLKLSIEHMEVSVPGRYAFITLSPDQKLETVPKSAIVDGRRLVFAWGNRVSVPPSLQRSVGAVVRQFLRQYR